MKKLVLVLVLSVVMVGCVSVGNAKEKKAAKPKEPTKVELIKRNSELKKQLDLSLQWIANYKAQIQVLQDQIRLITTQ